MSAAPEALSTAIAAKDGQSGVSEAIGGVGGCFGSVYGIDWGHCNGNIADCRVQGRRVESTAGPGRESSSVV